MDINQEIEHLQQRLELLPEEIEHLNFELLKETVDMAYTDIRTMGKEIPKLTDEILYLRQQLSEKWEQKTSMETRVDMLYSYLHNTLGYEETDKLDKEFL